MKINQAKRFKDVLLELCDDDRYGGDLAYDEIKDSVKIYGGNQRVLTEHKLSEVLDLHTFKKCNNEDDILYLETISEIMSGFVIERKFKNWVSLKNGCKINVICTRSYVYNKTVLAKIMFEEGTKVINLDVCKFLLNYEIKASRED